MAQRGNIFLKKLFGFSLRRSITNVRFDIYMGEESSFVFFFLFLLFFFILCFSSLFIAHHNRTIIMSGEERTDWISIALVRAQTT
jgi:hypothetical protein